MGGWFLLFVIGVCGWARGMALGRGHLVTVSSSGSGLCFLTEGKLRPRASFIVSYYSDTYTHTCNDYKCVLPIDKCSSPSIPHREEEEEEDEDIGRASCRERV